MARAQRSPAAADRTPVIVLAFANDRYGPTTGYLRDLVAERRSIERALGQAPVEVVTCPNATLDDLFDVLARHNDHVVALHYGGHAGADALFLEDAAGQPAAAGVEGLAERLGQLPRLALVVLNGCSTAGQVEVLQARSHAAIVATDQGIVDAAAREFAGRFYTDLAADRSIHEAFDSAASASKASLGPDRAFQDAADDAQPQTRMLRPAEPTTTEGWPWRLHIRAGHPETAGWRLSAVAPQRARRLPWRLPLLELMVLVGGLIALGPWATSDVPVCVPSTERCNAADDDCDGIADEVAATDRRGLCPPFGLEPVWGAAQCRSGACAIASCPAGWHDVDGDYATGCEYACQPAADGIEICNAADDDCDGVVDEGFAGCDLGCDGRDDDGDGRSDEACPAVRCGPERAGLDPVPPCNGCPDGIEIPSGWVCIPPGQALVGSDRAWRRGYRTSQPSHTATVPRPLLMMATELTRAEWAAIARAHGAGTDPSYFPCPGPEPGQCPVERVSHFEAAWFANMASAAAGLTQCYDLEALGTCPERPGGGCPGDNMWGGKGCATNCGRATRVAGAPDCPGLRLPTTDEWAYAARAGQSTRFVGGDAVADLERSAWYSANSAATVQPVGQKAPNDWGLYDVLGNVAEWVQEPHFRGCAFGDGPADCDIAVISKKVAGRAATVGIRLVRTLPER